MSDPQTVLGNGCVCSHGCDSCTRLAEAWEAMREVVDAAFGPVPGGPNHLTWAETVRKAHAALALAERVRQ